VLQNANPSQDQQLLSIFALGIHHNGEAATIFDSELLRKYSPTILTILNCNGKNTNKT
jgi:hypothetical protein